MRAAKRRNMARIVVADDEPEIRVVIKRPLENAGHIVVDAAVGRVGIFEFQRADIDVVITDMPGQNGLETVRMLKKLRPALKIIMNSGSYAKEPDYLPAADELGVDHILGKPRPAEARPPPHAARSALRVKQTVPEKRLRTTCGPLARS